MLSDHVTPKIDPCLIDGAKALQRRLRNSATLVNSFVAIVVLGGYQIASSSWSPRAFGLELAAFAVMTPIIGFVMKRIQSYFNRAAYTLLDRPHNSRASTEEFAKARQALLMTPWRAICACSVIWLFIVPPVVHYTLVSFNEPAQPIDQLRWTGLSVLPFVILCLLVGFDVALKPFAGHFFPKEHHEAEKLTFAMTVRKRLIITITLLGPYTVAMFALAIYHCAITSRTLDEAVRRVISVEAYTLAVSLLMVAAAVVYVRTQIDRPLKDLLAAVKQVSSGDLNAKLPVGSFDEWGMISASFNGMVEGLQERDSLSEQNSQLVVQLEKRALEAESMLRLYNEASDQARTDALSGLCNRRAFEEHLVQNFLTFKRYRIPFAIILIDIDHFKKVNDTFGHATGDFVINSVARCLKMELRLSDTAARWGGEEFIICLPHNDLASSSAVAERMRLSCEQMHLNDASDNPLPKVTLSLGVALARPDDECAEAIVERADKGLYAAKTAGRNRVHSIEPDWSLAFVGQH